MEALSLLLEASAAQDCGEFVDYASRVGAKLLPEHAQSDLDAVDAILHLRRESFDSTGVQWPDSFRYPPSGIGEDGKLARRRRAMSEPWVTMSSNTFSQVKEEKDSPAKRGSAPFHPALLQPRFPQPLMAIPTQPHAPGMPHRMPTIEEFAPLCNTNGRIGIYTKEEREVLIRRFRDKKKRRIWKKKIRYECRKDLADRRTRVKGRFVKAPADAIASGVPVVVKIPKSKQSGIVLTMQASGSLSSDNTSEETSGSFDGQPPLTFRLPSRKAVANHRQRPVKPLELDRFDSSEDKLKYLASILGGEMSDSHSPEDDDEDDFDDEEEEDEDEDEDEDSNEKNAHVNIKMVIDDGPAPVVTKSGRTVRPSRSRSGSEIDYRRPRRHSIAY